MDLAHQFRSLLIGFFTLFFVIAGLAPLQAETAAFDLIGPKVEVRVQRDGRTLPISQS